ncbi:serine/threonine protein kinase [Spirosoma terrae]|uniref:non-specific serine/threonine protein kinase n=1 Tax=Spirosoma terrae TaxID=1968276 RepID=A0A6L9LAY4_9BACT|nr:serine/threonine-protein kinase [Spirosoma terrae]NDU96667.1 protein kinase [Spirosoma terrae]
MQPIMKGRQIHHYRIESLLGEGGMGTVYQAVDIHLERSVAIKMLHPHLVNQTSFMERFRNEAMILARLNHPNIAVVYNFIQDGADYCMAMEYVEGNSLETLIHKAGAIPPATAAEITRQGLEGLAHAHRKGVLHRDIKPANLMLTPEGTVKLMDFGIARVVGNQRLTQVNRVVGTLEYMAPELIQGEAPSPASDIYAMGILLYELLSGKLPFASRTDYELMQTIIRDKPIALRKVNAHIPKELETIVLKALDKKPAKRFADAREFQKALQPFFSQAPQLNPSQLIVSQTTRDILAMQPARPTTLAATRIEKGVTNPAGHSIKTWLAENWQIGLAGALTAIAVAFISLILLDKSPNNVSVKPKQVTPNQPNVVDNQPKQPVQEKIKPASLATGTVVSRKPYEAQPTPVESKPTPTDTYTEPVVKPRASGTKPPAGKKNTPVTPAPVTPVTTPQEEVVTPPVATLKPEPVPEPTVPKTTLRRSVTIRRLRVTLALSDNISSDAAQKGQSVRFRVTEPVTTNGQVIIQAGATAYGEVSDVKKADGDVFRKKSLLEFRIHSVEAVNGRRISLRSATFSDEAKGQPVSFRSGQTFDVRTGDETIDL